MASDSILNDRTEKVDFQNLEPLLQKSLKCKHLQVIKYEATKLVPLGENYGSMLVKIDVTIRRNRNSEEEQLHLAAKTMNQVPRPTLDWPLVIKKEIFAYRDLLPMYRDLEREVGIEENELIDILPKYIGYRYSLDENNEEGDEHSLLLMENIKARGYYNCDRRTGLDVHHARKVLTALARYHALGITLKHRRPDFFAKAVSQARVLGIDFEQVREGFDASLKDFTDNPSIAGDHLPIIQSSYERFKNDTTFTVSLDEPWATITHGDSWVNNVLFHKDEQGNVDDIKLVDFQVFLFHSALKDLPYFLATSLDDNTTANHIDELLHVYYEIFIKTLERMGIDSKVFTRKSFECELKKQAINEFPLCALASKFFIFEVSEEQKSDEIITNVLKSNCNDVLKRRLTRLIHTFEKRSWF